MTRGAGLRVIRSDDRRSSLGDKEERACAQEVAGS